MRHLPGSGAADDVGPRAGNRQDTPSAGKGRIKRDHFVAQQYQFAAYGFSDGLVHPRSHGWRRDAGCSDAGATDVAQIESGRRNEL